MNRPGTRAPRGAFVRSWCFVALLVLGCGVLPARAAQVTVPFDSAGTTRVLRPIRVKQLRLASLDSLVAPFPGYSAARLFALEDSSYVLEVSTVGPDDTRRADVALTRDEVARLRHAIGNRLQHLPLEPDTLDRVARRGFLTQNAGLGVMFYGPAVPFILDLPMGLPAVGAYVVSTGSSFIIPWLASQNTALTSSMTSLSLYGSTRGLAHGLLLADPMSRDVLDRQVRRDAVAAMLTLSVLEGYAGYMWARGNGLSAGTTATIATGGDFGFLWGYNIAALAGSDRVEWSPARSRAMLAGSWTGLAMGHVLGSHRQYSYGDALVMRNAGYLGILVSTTIADLTQRPHHRDPRVYSAALLSGSLLGLWYGDRQVHDYNFEPSDGVALQLGTGAGAIMGLGVSALSNNHSSRGFWIAATAGALVGYHVTYGAITRRIKHPRDDASSWRFEIAPEGALAMLGQGPAELREMAPPIVRLAVRF